MTPRRSRCIRLLAFGLLVAPVCRAAAGELLVPPGAACRIQVPASNALGLSWTQPEGFDDSGWISGLSAIGYQRPAGSYTNLIQSTVANSTMSVLARWAFTLTNAPSANVLTLRVQYDDGFIAYLNGIPVASANAPSVPAYNALATAEHPNAAALQAERFDLTAYLDDLHAGTNVLAIQVFNYSTAPLASDLLMQPVLEAETYLPAGGAGVIIHEIHSNPDNPAERVEFVELLNTTTNTVDLSGWSFTSGIAYTFRPGRFIPPQGYAVVTQDPVAFSNKFQMVALGPFAGTLDNGGEVLTLRNGLGERVDDVAYGEGFPWPTVGDAPGATMQLMHPALDNNLGGNWRSGLPTPGASNGVGTAANRVPPCIRQVEHRPRQPVSGSGVTVTAKVTDPDGVADVTLLYQLVDPGNFLTRFDAAYSNTWTAMPMHDDGLAGDALAGDSLYTVQLPGALQTHRRLVRYRITVADLLGNSLRVPYADDPQPNFAYFVYDGVPSWTAADQPGVSPSVTYGSNVMAQLPVYHLLAKQADVEGCTWIDRYYGSDYLWTGAVVFDGTVYDHIGFRARGGVWRYAMGKNAWKIGFNRGHLLAARDNLGRLYAEKRNSINLRACIQQGVFGRRGEQGMYEALAFRLMNLAGVPASNTDWATLRIIDSASEAGADQYSGDYWGMYLVVEQMDGHFLKEHEQPDGNLYAIESGGTLNNQGPTAATDGSDLRAFMAGYGAAPDSAWWVTNVDVDAYFSFRAICDGIHHYDMGTKNYYYYLNPEPAETGLGAYALWSILPWDTDLTWADNMFDSGGQGVEPFKENGLWTHPALQVRRNNRIREIRDLLFNTDEGWRLIDEYAARVWSSNGLSSVNADRAQWDYHPIMNSAYVSGSQAGQGRFYLATPTHDFPGMVKLMRDYLAARATGTLDPQAADAAIPATPTVVALTSGFPVNGLTFRCSAFSDPQGSNTFQALAWRLGEISDPAAPAFDPAAPGRYEIEARWESGSITTFVDTITLPGGAAQVGHTYRLRARMQDTTGRWSHWSAPVPFTATESDNALALAGALRLTELMVAPAGGSANEFVELYNSSSNATLDLNGVRFSDGIDFTFSSGTLLPPLSYLLVVQAASSNDFATFRSAYNLPPSVPIVGPYGGSLNNSGEFVTLKTASAGSVIATTTYSPGRGWPLAAAGAGHSLVPLVLGDQATGKLNYGGNWRASTYQKGSPGGPDPAPIHDVVLNEIVAHTDYTNAAMPAYDSNDGIELFNTLPAPQALTDWFLSDDPANLRLWPIPAGATLPSHGWLAFDEVAGFHHPITNGFGLNKAGEAVFLSYLPGNTNDRVADAVAFKGQENDIAWGRHPDGDAWWRALMPATAAVSNAAPLTTVVINEVMFHPAPVVPGGGDNARDEYIELRNVATNRVELWNADAGPWRIDGGVSFAFPANTSLAAGESLLLVSFNPVTEPAALQAFRDAYGVTGATVRVLGPYSGKLSNGGERIALERGVAPDLPGDPFAWAILDEVIYFDQAPWPAGADGTGLPLQRLAAGRPGGDPANWSAAYVATPGRDAVTVADSQRFAAWPNRMPIRFGGYGKAEALNAFPALVVLSTNLPGFHYHQFASPTGGDLRFTDATGLHALSHEVERWNPDGESTVWVKLPQLVGADTTIWAYWGNPDQTNPPAGAATWSDGYAGVWHMNGLDVRDSSPHGNHATATGVIPADGAIAGALQYPAGTGAVMVADYPHPTNTLTVMAWVRAGSIGVGNSIAKNWGGTRPGAFALGLGRNLTLEGWLSQADGVTLTNAEPRGAGSSFPTGTWQQVSLVADGAALRLYRNGREVSVSVACSGTLRTDFAPLGLGVRPDDSGVTSAERWAGWMDEVTVAQAARSSNWIWACWLNVAFPGAFAQAGDVQSVDADANHNGIPDAWERAHFGGEGLPPDGGADDPDADTSDNWAEYVAGTDPTNAVDRLALAIRAADPTVVVTWDGRRADGAGYEGLTRWYDLEASSNLVDAPWLPVPAFTGMPGDNRPIDYTNALDRWRWYRVRVRLE
ncbi:MAG: DUF2341 domain-containing protein [Lentisphaerae bacterium]|nr:DUF2341 domain-containing protein [Lentisphaerota bacterium]